MENSIASCTSSSVCNSCMSKQKKVMAYLYAFRASTNNQTVFAPVQEQIWSLLTATAFHGTCIEKECEPSISIDGTPFITSLKLGDKRPALRGLFEPSGTGATLADRIDFSLSVIATLYQQLGWSKSARDINWFSRGIFPANPIELGDWWGGIWLGVELLPQASPELRVYFNLRAGTLKSRWQKLSNLLIPYTQDGTLQPLGQGFSENVISFTAIPVGVGIVIRDDRVHGIRLYQSLERADSQMISRIFSCEPEFAEAEKNIIPALQKLESKFGLAAPQSITISHDFIMKDNIIGDSIHRIKCDINCRPYVAIDQDYFENWIKSTLNVKQEKSIYSYATLLQDHFGGAELDYFSMGITRTNQTLRTVYVKPLHLSSGTNA
jgi:hypothetical protein